MFYRSSLQTVVFKKCSAGQSRCRQSKNWFFFPLHFPTAHHGEAAAVVVEWNRTRQTHCRHTHTHCKVRYNTTIPCVVVVVVVTASLSVDRIRLLFNKETPWLWRSSFFLFRRGRFHHAVAGERKREQRRKQRRTKDFRLGTVSLCLFLSLSFSVGTLYYYYYYYYYYHHHH